jgi:hypothetical protein
MLADWKALLPDNAVLSGSKMTLSEEFILSSAGKYILSAGKNRRSPD